MPRLRPRLVLLLAAARLTERSMHQERLDLNCIPCK